jgi:hypothetical protein
MISSPLGDIRKGTTALADRANDAAWLRDLGFKKGGCANTRESPTAHQRSASHPVSTDGTTASNASQTNLNITAAIATRSDKLEASFLAMVKLACIRLRMRHYEAMA